MKKKRVMSSAYLRLLIFLPAILIPACASASSAFCMMYSAYKLNKQGDNIQLSHTPFPTWNQSYLEQQTASKLGKESLIHIQLFVLLWTIACQAPLSKEFSRQEYWSG